MQCKMNEFLISKYKYTLAIFQPRIAKTIQKIIVVFGGDTRTCQIQPRQTELIELRTRRTNELLKLRNCQTGLWGWVP